MRRRIGNLTLYSAKASFQESRRAVSSQTSSWAGLVSAIFIGWNLSNDLGRVSLSFRRFSFVEMKLYGISTPT